MSIDLRSRRALRDLAQRFIDDVIATVLEGGGEAASSGPAGRPRRRVRRRAHKLEELREAVLAALGDRGGSSIGEIARQIGSTPRELSRPIAVLLAEGRIVKTGERKGTRYWLEAKRDARSRSIEPPAGARRAPTAAGARRAPTATAARRAPPVTAARRGSPAARPSSKKKPARARPKRGR